jgi:hypothetical protein
VEAHYFGEITFALVKAEADCGLAISKRSKRSKRLAMLQLSRFTCKQKTLHIVDVSYPDPKKSLPPSLPGQWSNALVAAFSGRADTIHKITIVPRGHAALGYTLQLPEGDQFLRSRAELKDKIKGLLGGRPAEEVVFGEITTGAENDLGHATAIARQMGCVFGMGESVGLVHCAQKRAQFLPDASEDGGGQRDCSEETAREIDEEVKKSSVTRAMPRNRFCGTIEGSSMRSPTRCRKKKRSMPKRLRACLNRNPILLAKRPRRHLPDRRRRENRSE